MPNRLIVFFSLTALMLVFCGPTPSYGQPSEEAQTAASIAKIPINFEPNYGQASPSARFVAHAGNVDVEIRSLGIDLSLHGQTGKGATVKLDFTGASPNAGISASDRRAGQSNYLIGRDPFDWQTHVPNFGRVTYTNLYPGIDVAFYGNGQHLEHDFLVAPGADYHAIRLRVTGTNKLSLGGNGSLVLSCPDGDLVFHVPQVYQLSESGRQTLHARFIFLDKNEISFEIEKYDRSKPLIIDPVLDYQTFITSSYFLTVGLAADASGDTFVMGVTTASGAVRVMKLNPSGTGLIYTTDIGDSCQPFGGMVIDANGDALVAITTTSPNLTTFPLKNAIPFGNQGNGSWYGYIFSLTPDGSSINYASLLGGGSQPDQSSETSIVGVAEDIDGNAYIAGYTNSPTFPVTPGALNNNNEPPGNFTGSVIYAMKFTPIGSLGYSALINGNANILAIAADKSGAYITGSAGTLWPITNGAYQTTIPGTSNPLMAPFVTKLSPDGSSLIYSTFVGSDARPTAITLNTNGEAFITGGYAPGTFPTTSNAYLKSLAPQQIAGSFLTELNATGSQLVYSSFFYGSVNSPYSNTVTTDIARDASGNIWLSGTTNDLSFPLVQPLQTIPSTSGLSLPGFVAELDGSGSKLVFSTYIGDPSSGAQSLNVVADPQGKIHVAGITGWELYTSPGAFIATVPPPPSNADVLYGFVAVFDPSVQAPWACVSPVSGLNFKNVPVNASASLLVTITNCSDLPLTIRGVQPSSTAFTIPSSSNHCLQTLALNSVCTFSVAFSPTAVSSYSGTLLVTSNAGMPMVLPLQGGGFIPTPAQAYVSPTSLFFDPVFAGKTSAAQTVTVGNGGQQPLLIDSANAVITTGFTFTQSKCDQPVVPMGHCTFLVTFAPQAAGDTKGTLTFTTNDPNNHAVSVSLEGLGLTAYPVPTVTTVTPPTVLMGSGTTQIQVIGNYFFPSSVVLVNGAAQTTSYQNLNVLNATLSGSLFASLGEIQVAVFNPAPGGGESNPGFITIYQTVQIPASAMIYEPVSKLLFAALPANAATNPNSIVSIDPSTAKIGTVLPVGHDPQKLAVSDDGQYLYVALNADHTIQRVNLKTLSVEKTFSLPDPNLFVTEMKVLPGAPTSLVVAVGVGGPAGIAFLSESGIVNWLGNDFQDGYVQVDTFAFAGIPPLVYSIPFSFTPNFFNVFTVDSSGIHRQSTGPTGSTDLSIGTLLVSDGRLLYTNSGNVWDPSTQTLLQSYSPAPYDAATILPDLSRGVTFFLDPYANYAQNLSGAVDAYDQKTLERTGTVPFFPFYGTDMVGLARWGDDGFAFLFSTNQPVLGSGQVVLFHSSIARGTSPDFIFRANPPITAPVSIFAAGSDSTPITLAITAENNYSGTVTFSPSSCAISPAGSLTTCSFIAPGAVTGSGSIQLVLHTTAAKTSRALPKIDVRGYSVLGVFFSLAGMFSMSFGLTRKRRVRVVTGVSWILFSLFLAVFSGCGTGGGISNGGSGGGSGGGTPGTPTGVTYTVTVTANSNGGAPTHILSFTFLVQ